MIHFQKITKSEAVQVGALIYRGHFGMDKTKFQNVQGLINQLVPDDILSDQKHDDWKKQIVNAYSKQIGKKKSSFILDLFEISMAF